MKDFTDEQLIKELQKRGYVRLLWHRDDITIRAEALGITLSDEQINNIVRSLENSDCEYGISYSLIDHLIESA